MRRVAVVLLLVLLALPCAGQSIIRPTSETSTAVSPISCNASSTWRSGTLPNFWDSGGEGTTSSQTVSASGIKAFKSTRISGFSNPVGSYTSINLIVKWGCNSDISASCAINVSINGGSTYTTVATSEGTNSPSISTTVPLTVGQNLTLLRVQWEACAVEVGGLETVSASITGKDIRVEYSSGAPAAARKVQTVED